MNLVSNAENAYWDVVAARENLRVARGRARCRGGVPEAVSRSNWNSARFRRWTFTVRSRQLATQRSRAWHRPSSAWRSVEDTLRKQIGADLDPQVRASCRSCSPKRWRCRCESINDRSRGRRSVRRCRTGPISSRRRRAWTWTIFRSSSRAMRLLPNLALIGNYNVNGRGGVFLQRTNVFNDGITSPVLTSIPGGLADALGQMFGFGFSTYQLGLRLIAAHPEPRGFGGHGRRNRAQEAGRAECAHHAADDPAGHPERDHQRGIQQGIGEAGESGAGFRPEELWMPKTRSTSWAPDYQQNVCWRRTRWCRRNPAW